MTPKRIAGHEIIDPATWRAHASFMLHQAEEARRMAAEEQAKRDECPDCATLRAQLAGVRERVEKLDRYDPIVDCNEPYMEHTERGDYFSCADVLTALGGDA